MKFLFTVSDVVKCVDICWGLMELGYEVEQYAGKVTAQIFSEEEKEALVERLKKGDITYVISQNFYQTVGEACRECHIPYIAWIMDAPQIDLYTEYAKNEYLYIFSFDKAECKRMREKGLERVFHTPLATNIAKTSALEISEADIKKYRSDISFVGRLYDNNSYNELQKKCPPVVDQYFQKMFELNAMDYSKQAIYGIIPDSLMDILVKCFGQQEQYNMTNQEFFPFYLLARKLTQIERIFTLNLLAEACEQTPYRVSLFTDSDTKPLENVDIRPAVKYDTEMPKVFYSSKINLNITLRCITSGIPLRVFDIMGVGGFCLTNYQPELPELFELDKELVAYKSAEELLDKVDFYMDHEKERLTIAMNGYKKVKEFYSYPKRLEQIVSIVQKS